MAKLANAYLEAEGTCRGTPKLKAGCTVKVEGVGSRFSGTYRVTSTHARLPRQQGLRDAGSGSPAARRAAWSTS